MHICDIARGDRRRSTFLKIMNRPKRYLSRESLPYEEVAFDVWEEYYEEQGWMVQRLEKLQMDLKVIAGMRPYSAINYIRKGVAYEDYLREYAEVRRIPFEDLADVLDELQENARGFETFDSWFEHIKQLGEELRNRQKAVKSGRGCQLEYTASSSKVRLEYDTVFVVDVNENVMPNKKAVLDADLEEERRMFYVGMTRAKNRLYLLWSHQIRNKDMDPSRFLIECESAQTKR
ncbi:MAG: 3'-5' exonuclease [Eubacterium sp.]